MALIAHWPLNGTLKDITGNGYDLVLAKGSWEYKNGSKLGKYIGSTSDITTTADNYIVFSPSKPIATDSVLSGKSFSFSVDIKRLSTWNEIDAGVPELLFGNVSGDGKASEGLLPDSITPSVENRTFSIYSWPDAKSLHVWFGRKGTNAASNTYPNVFGFDRWNNLTVVFNRETGISHTYINGIKMDLETYIGEHEILSTSETMSLIMNRNYVSDAKLYDHALTDKEVKEMLEEPIIDLDFQGFNPPSENILNDLVISPSGSPDVETITPNQEYIIEKAGLYQPAIYTTLPSPTSHRKFTLSFDLDVLDGRLDTIGGHCGSPDTGGFSSNVYINGFKNSEPYWLSPNVNPSGTPGNHYHVKVEFSVISSEATGWIDNQCWIQPNRGVATRIKARVYNIKMEPGDLDSDFFTGTRDYMEIKNNTSFFRSFKYRGASSIPSINPSLRLSKGSKSCLEIKDTDDTTKKRFCFDNVFPPEEYTACLVCRINKLPSNRWESFLFSMHGGSESTVHRMYSCIHEEDKSFFVDYVENSKVKSTVRAEVGGTYVVVIRASKTTLDLFVNKSVNSINAVANKNFYIDPVNTLTLGVHNNPGNSAIQDLEISDFKLFGRLLSNDEINLLSDKLSSNTSSFAFAFDDSIDVSSTVPKLWETNVNAEGTQCFSRNPLITNKSEIPLSWGGEVIQPEQAVAKLANAKEVSVTTESTMLVYADGGSHVLTEMSVTIDGNDTDSELEFKYSENY